MLFFFFQAEDGIRDTSVTGVQTCALPILPPRALGRLGLPARAARHRDSAAGEGVRGRRLLRRDDARSAVPSCDDRRGGPRSEERRVGKEGRSRWGGGCEKKKREVGKGGRR